LYFGICGLILSSCPFSPQLARRRRRRKKTKKKQKKEDKEEEEEEEEEICFPNWVISDPT
jgi:ribosomal protein L12E/L44/L45/RPP1/RPP2